MRTLDKYYIEIVHGCNLRCIGCPISKLHDKINYITIPDLKAIIKNTDVRYVELLRLFNFGEPMLHPDLPDIVATIKKTHFKKKIVEISTNGQVHRFDVLKEVLKQRVVNQIAISCDGDCTKEEYERMRPPGKWEKLLEFSSELKRLRNKYSPKTHLVARVIFTGNKKKWKSMLAGYEVKFRNMFKLVDSVAFETPNKIPGGLCVFVDRKRSKRLFVDYDGTVVPCCRHPRAFVEGNIIGNTYSEILKSDHYKHIIETMKKDRHSMDICGACDKS